MKAETLQRSDKLLEVQPAVTVTEQDNVALKRRRAAVLAEELVTN